jgi:hypothetical protein
MALSTSVLTGHPISLPLSVTRREDIDQLREMAQGRFVNVR